MGGDRVPTLTVPVPSRESVASKAIRILLERRLTILSVKRDRVYAECRGTDKVWHPCWVNGKWGCDCEARGKCAHLAALKYVVVRPED